MNCHYLIEDASGKSVVVEYWDHKLQTVKTNENYQVLTNFIQYGRINLGEGATEFKRYDIVHNSLSKTNGVLNEKEVMAVLKSAKIDNTQWSEVYNLKELKGEVCIAGDYSNPYSFSVN